MLTRGEAFIKFLVLAVVAAGLGRRSAIAIKHVVACTTVILVAGCGMSAADRNAADQSKCVQYGFAPGTDAFARCMMASDMRREDQNAAAQRDVNRRIELDNARTTADFRARLMAP